MTTQYDPSPALAYASPMAGGGSPVVAGVWVMVGGLVLIFFGGCFCIGVLMLTSNAFNAGFGGPPPPRPLTWEQEGLMLVLYAAAFACLGCGGWVGWLGLRKLLAVGR